MARRTDERFAADFWKRVDTSAGDDGCWPWRGPVGTNGYGSISIRRSGRWTSANAHAVANFLAAHRWTSPGEVVRHHCDNPICCNPSHLEIGTHKQNYADAVSRGRRPKGVEFPQAKLTDEKVAWMRRQVSDGQGVREVAEAAGVAPSTAGYAVAGRTWGHVEGAVGQRPSPRGEDHGRARLTEHDVLTIREEFSQGSTVSDLAAKYGLNTGHVSRLVNRKAWKHLP